MSPLSRALWWAGWPARTLLLAALGAYRRLLSPMLGQRCRFYPSCSTYAEEAIRVHGAFKGVLLAGWRLLRCSPLTGGGPDAVPRKGAWRPGEPGNAGPSYDSIIPQGGA